MSQVKTLSKDDLSKFVGIISRSFPNMQIDNQENRRFWLERFGETYDDPIRSLYGLYRAEELLGGMMIYDFNMNFRGTMIPAGGVGLVAVDLLHKRQHVAKEMIEFSIDHFRQREMPIVLLYPFRPDFYKKMGFGYGSKVNQYRIDPASFPMGPSKSNVRYMGKEDKSAILECYDRFAQRTHGMILGMPWEIDFLINNESIHIVGYEVNGNLLGFLSFEFKPFETFMVHDLVIRHFIYENAEAFTQLSTFLHTQKDQVQRINVNTLDDQFHFILADTRDGSGQVIPHVYHQSNVQGVGLMYRIVDAPLLFKLIEKRSFGSMACRLKIDLVDSFFPNNNGSTIVNFTDGTPRLGDDDYEVAIKLDVAELSSLLIGSITFKKLYEYGLAQTSDEGYLDTVNQLFIMENNPVCLTRF